MATRPAASVTKSELPASGGATPSALRGGLASRLTPGDGRACGTPADGDSRSSPFAPSRAPPRPTASDGAEGSGALASGSGAEAGAPPAGADAGGSAREVAAAGEGAWASGASAGGVEGGEGGGEPGSSPAPRLLRVAIADV
eukprot:2013044-Prymnesium_polylepis.1